MDYDPSFMRYTTGLNESSARVVTKLLSEQFKPKSVVDFGCAQGGWLNAWAGNGVGSIQGLDGAYIDQSSLLIAGSDFMAVDLGRVVDLDRTFDIAQCLEVAEHLPESSSRILVENLTSHAAIVLFSAAPPGQGGRGHINEQPYEYWRDLFAEKDYGLYDWVRPRLSGRKDVQPWYRYNLFLFAHSQAELPKIIKDAGISSDAEIPDISSLLYRLRKNLVKIIPGGMQKKISNLLAERNASNF